MTKKKAAMFLITGVLFTSVSSIIIRLSAAPALVIAFYRMAFAAVLTLPLMAGREYQLKRTRKPGAIAATCLSGSRMTYSVLSGILLAGHFAFWITSLQHTTIASSVVLVSTHPLFVGIGAFFLLKEPLGLVKLLCILVVLTGTALLSYGDLALGPGVLYGNALALLGAICMAGYLIIGRYVRQTVEALYYTGFIYAISVIVLFVISLAMNVPLYPYSLNEFVLFFCLAFFCTILGHTLYNVAIKYISAFIVSTSILIEPIAATILAMLIFNEIPSPVSLLGAVCILSGVYISVRKTE